MTTAIPDLVQRREALDPRRSFIVQAPAGSGKTELLIQRYLLLLAGVNHAEEIIAVTFTKKAAGEMRERVLQALADAQSEKAPESEHERLTLQLAAAALKRDREAGWQLVDNPAQLRIQTIDSLCAGLTRQMPVLSRFGAQPDSVEDAEVLYRQAAQATIALVNETDAATIRRIFGLYLEEGNVAALHERLAREDIRTAARYSAKGNHYGNRPFTRGHLYKLLSSPIYIGRVPHKAISHRGQHTAIIEKSTWDAVQAKLAENTQGSRSRRRRAAPKAHLLEGLLHTQAGSRFIASGANKGAKRYRYYVEDQTGQDTALLAARLSATEIEAAVITGLRGVLADPRALLAHLEAASSVEAPAALRAASVFQNALGGRIDQDLMAKARQILRRVTVGHDRLLLSFSIGGLRTVLGIPKATAIWATNEPEVDEEFSVAVPYRPARRGRQMKLVLPGAGSVAAPNRSLVTATVRAWDWAERLTTGEVGSMAEICAAEGFTDTYIGQVLPLAFLSPDLVEQILTGRQPDGLTASKLIWRERLPLLWQEQMAMFGAG